MFVPYNILTKLVMYVGILSSFALYFHMLALMKRKSCIFFVNYKEVRSQILYFLNSQEKNKESCHPV